MAQILLDPLKSRPYGREEFPLCDGKSLPMATRDLPTIRMRREFQRMHDSTILCQMLPCGYEAEHGRPGLTSPERLVWHVRQRPENLARHIARYE